MLTLIVFFAIRREIVVTLFSACKFADFFFTKVQMRKQFFIGMCNKSVNQFLIDCRKKTEIISL